MDLQPAQIAHWVHFQTPMHLPRVQGVKVENIRNRKAPQAVKVVRISHFQYFKVPKALHVFAMRDTHHQQG